MVKWTNEQQAVIDHESGNLLVSAAAGSGKTTVMVERIIRLVVDKKIPLSKILVVTFTDAAAASMRIKVIDKLQELVAGNDEDSRFYRNQLNRINDAHISTVHRFCLFVLRRYYAMAEIEPGLKAADSVDTTILRNAAMDQIIEDAFEAKDKDFLALVDIYGGRDGGGLSTIVESMYNYAVSRDDRLDFIHDSIEASIKNCDDLENSIYMNTLVDLAKSDIRRVYYSCKYALELCESPYGVQGYLKAIRTDFDMINNAFLALDGTRDDMLRALAGISFGTIGRKSKTDDAASIKIIKDIRADYKKVCQSAWDKLLLDDAEGEKRKILAMSHVMKSLYELVVAFDDRFTLEKQMRGVMDFDDMQRYALKALKHPVVREDINKQFDYVFVDEYQDTNSMQEAIITSVARPDNLFCVGDVKQSIYRFRHTDPTLFLDRRENSSIENGSINKRIDLSKNFRSSSDVVGVVNDVFSRIMTASFGDVEYKGSELLVQGADDMTASSANVEMLLMVTDVDETTDTQLADMSNLQLQALEVGNRIRKIYGQPIHDKGVLRSARWKDFTILTRTAKNVHSEIAGVLSSLNIPVYASTNSGIFDEMESRWLLAILRLIDNFDRDIDLISALHSPMYNLSLGELMIIRQRSMGRDVMFSTAVHNYSQKHDDNIARTITKLINQLHIWRKQASWLTVDRLIWQVLDDTGLYDMMGAMTEGSTRQANLQLLAGRAKALSDTAAGSLYGFLKHVDKLKSGGGDSEQAQLITEAADVVRIMTIHGSKGLEFPIVFIMNMERRLVIPDMSGGDSILLNSKLGIAPNFYHAKKRARVNNIIRTSIKYQNQREEISELLRLLYVAMTRAQQKLIMVGSIREDRLENKIDSYKLPIIPEILMGKTSFMDWVMPVLIRNPKADVFRAITETNISVHRDAIGNIDFDVIPTGSLQLYAMDNETSDVPLPIFDAKIKEQLMWRYPYTDSGILPSKTSATAMVEGRAPGSVKPPEPLQAPKFMGKEKYVSAAMRGTITHQIFQYVDTSMDREAVIMLMSDLEDSGVLNPGEGELVNIDHVMGFLNHDIARRMDCSKRIIKEQPFTLRLPAKELYEGFDDSDEAVLLQGIIDLAFLEDDGWVLIDYKTNYISEKRGGAELLMHYKPQLRIYKAALNALTNTRVKQAGLYLTELNDVVFE